jgi:hypothetical protein
MTEMRRRLERALDQRFTAGAGRIGAAAERAAALRSCRQQQQERQQQQQQQQQETVRVRVALEERLAAGTLLAAELAGTDRAGVAASGRGRS